jgi:hypothetical protein
MTIRVCTSIAISLVLFPSLSWSGSCRDELVSIASPSLALTQGGVDLLKGKPTLHLVEQRQILEFGKQARHVANSGSNNRGVFRLIENGKTKAIFKVTPYLVNERHPSGFLRALQGMILQASEGGPKVYDFGSIVEPDGRRYFYVELEALFAGERTSNLKDLKFDQPNLIRELSEKQVSVARKMGDQLASAFEHKILPIDPDFFVSQSGAVRWIDGERWADAGSYRNRVYEFGDCFWTTYEYLKKATGRDDELWKRNSAAFLDSFFLRLKRSHLMGVEDRERLLRDIFKGQISKDLIDFSDSRAIPASEVKRIYEDALEAYQRSGL